MRNHYRKKGDPRQLFLDGPILQVEITLPQAAARLRNFPPKHQITALIDTGATITAIDRSVAQALKLRPINTIRLLGADGPYDAAVYVINFVFIGSDIKMIDHQVTEADLSEQNCRMLIGRDVLSRCSLTYDGVKGIVDIDFPVQKAAQSIHCTKKSEKTCTSPVLFIIAIIPK